MKNIKLLSLIIVSSVLLNSCATLISGTKQNVSIKTDPSGARVFVDGKDQNVITPCNIDVKRKKEVVYTFQKEGYKDGKVTENAKFNTTVLWNILLGGIPGFIVDFSSGANNKYQDNVFYKFQNSDSDPTIPKGAEKERVTRDNPGATTLEKTIIRWFIDSEPRGARVFWRVVSNVPAEVKNTNELYLMTTPLEQTRAFDILGLTYANSRNVEIEVKCSKRGYEDQIKRFNARQAIDQAEISAFFELVKKEQ